MIELFLSTDGKHTVHVQTLDKEEMDSFLPYARALYQKIVQELGTKPQLWGEVMNGKKGNNGQFGIRIDNPQQAEDLFAPKCPVHGTPMKKRNGQYGEFWSCGQKNPDGSWCKAKPDIPF